MPSYNFIIDTKSAGHKEIMRRLERLKSTLSLVDNGYYINCTDCSQLSITTILDEEQLEHWLWKNNLDYVGVCNDS